MKLDARYVKSVKVLKLLSEEFSTRKLLRRHLFYHSLSFELDLAHPINEYEWAFMAIQVIVVKNGNPELPCRIPLERHPIDSLVDILLLLLLSLLDEELLPNSIVPRWLH